MNFQYIETFPPIKVLVVNPLSPAGQLTIVKILSGTVFGSHQLIDLIILVNSNERSSADTFSRELGSCAFSCTNSIKISTDLPNQVISFSSPLQEESAFDDSNPLRSVSDADVFGFITNFPNPNTIDFDNIDSKEYFDTIYLLIKIANHFSRSIAAESEKTIGVNNKDFTVGPEQKMPLFVADGLVAIDILYSLSKYLPPDLFFCPTPLTGLAKSVLGDYLKLKNYMINDILAWAANDEVFHLEVVKPLIVRDKVIDEGKCDWNVVNKREFELSNMDYTQFNASWMKKNFIEKVTVLSKKNPYGCIFKASELAKALKAVWTTRDRDGMKNHVSLGVISDGSLGTIKGYPYVLPLIFSGHFWSINKLLEDNIHLQGEVKRINKSVTIHHNKLIAYCNFFLKENVMKPFFMPGDESSVFTSVESLCSSNTSISN